MLNPALLKHYNKQFIRHYKNGLAGAALCVTTVLYSLLRVLMIFFHNVVCPVSNIKINSYVSRITVFMCAALLALYLITGLPYLVVIVAIDYGIRALWNPQYSPLRWIALRIASAAHLPEKLTDQAPKLFASRVGFLFAMVSTILFPLSIPASIIAAGILCVFATLDSVFDFCVGCLTYSYIVLPFYQFMGIRENSKAS